MNHYIDGKLVRLDASTQIVYAGEGAIHRYGKDEVIKIFHLPSPERAAKLKAMLKRPPTVRPGRLTMIHQLSTNDQGEVDGFSMPRLSAQFVDMKQLANANHRATFKTINSRFIAQLFLDGAQTLDELHADGYVVGDLNDVNELYEGSLMMFIDVNSFQFDTFPCVAAMPSFLNPRLYRQDLSVKPLFVPEDDAYCLSVMLFKSLTQVHPYGGTHPRIPLMERRAEQRIPVWDKAIQYPSIALPLDLISDDLMQEFDRRFVKGVQARFDRAVLQAYLDDLVDCSKCGTPYPSERNHCPICQTQHVSLPVPATPIAAKESVIVKVLFEFVGTVLFSKMVNDTFYLLTEQDNRLTLTVWAASGKRSRVMGAHVAGTRYDIFGDSLLHNPPHSNQVLCTDPAVPVLITDINAANRKAMVRSTGSQLLHIVGSNLMLGKLGVGHYAERPLRAVMPERTWFSAASDGADTQLRAAGFFQVFAKQHWWLYWGTRLYDDLSITQLEQGEVMTDILTRFDAYGALIRRSSQKNGTAYVHTSYLTPDGAVLNLPRIASDVDLQHGSAYARGVLLSPTDEGLQQEYKGAVKTFTQTKGVIYQSDTLYRSGSGILAVQKNQVISIQLT